VSSTVKADLLQLGQSQSALFLREQWERARDGMRERREVKMNVVN